MEREVIGRCTAQDSAYDRHVHYMREEHGGARRMRFCLRGRRAAADETTRSDWEGGGLRGS